MQRKSPTLFQDIDEFFEHCNVCVKYPLFYVYVLQELIGDFKITGSLLGSIVECYVRGLLRTYSYEFRMGDREIDYVDYVSRLAIEFTISNKRISNTNFDLLSDDWTKILLTRDQSDTVNCIIRIPYYEFIAKLCQNMINR